MKASSLSLNPIKMRSSVIWSYSNPCISATKEFKPLRADLKDFRATSIPYSESNGCDVGNNGLISVNKSRIFLASSLYPWCISLPFRASLVSRSLGPPSVPVGFGFSVASLDIVGASLTRYSVVGTSVGEASFSSSSSFSTESR